MRNPLACLVLLTALPACSQGVEKFWYADVHWFAPTLTGHFDRTSGSNPIDVDLQNDLGLAKDKTKVGFGLEYQGPRFGLELARDEEDYAGKNVVNRAITINGQTFSANTFVTSTVKAVNNTLNWTIRVFKVPQFWVGVDLGARATQLQIDATGVEPFTGVNAVADYKATLPVPQIGPSAGFSAAHGRVVARASYHLLAYKGATYSHPSVDLRFFPISWLGVLVFADAERFRVPNNSVKSDLDITMDRSGAGFGLVAKF